MSSVAFDPRAWAVRTASLRSVPSAPMASAVTINRLESGQRTKGRIKKILVRGEVA